MKLKNDYKGFNTHRFKGKNNPVEKAIAEYWQKYNTITTDQIRYIFHKVELTDREYRVIATIIQWLGSPVGQGFMEKINEIIGTANVRVSVNQVWESLDCREWSRGRLLIYKKNKKYAYVKNLKTGRKTRIKLGRFKISSTGYVFVGYLEDIKGK